MESALGIRPLEEVLPPEEEDAALPAVAAEEAPLPIVAEDTSAATEALADIEKARANIETLIDLGGDSLTDLIALAKQSESPRAFEVVSGMMKTLLDANKEFVAVSTQKKYVKEELIRPKEDQAAATTNVTNNNLILSTADLLSLIKGELKD